MESEEDTTLLTGMKGNYIKARAEMLKWSSRDRMNAWGRLEGGGLGLCSQPDSVFGHQQREGTRPLMRGKHLSWRQRSGKEGER